MEDIFLNRIVSAEKHVRRMRKNHAPTVPILAVGPQCSYVPIAQGSATGSSLTLTLDRDVNCKGTIHVIAAWGSTAATGSSSGSIVDISDSRGGVTPTDWSITTTGKPFIGYAANDDSWYSPGNPATKWLEVGTAGTRVMDSGFFHAGDTITLIADDGGYGDISFISAIAYAFSRINGSIAVAQGGFATYNNGRIYPASDTPTLVGPGATNTSLLWSPLTSLEAKPDEDAFMLTAMAAYPGVGDYSPALTEASTIGFEMGDCSLVVTKVELAEAGFNTEPGGTWSDPAQILVGNYQFFKRLSS